MRPDVCYSRMACAIPNHRRTHISRRASDAHFHPPTRRRLHHRAPASAAAAWGWAWACTHVPAGARQVVAGGVIPFLAIICMGVCISGTGDDTAIRGSQPHAHSHGHGHGTHRRGNNTTQPKAMMLAIKWLGKHNPEPSCHISATGNTMGHQEWSVFRKRVAKENQKLHELATTNMTVPLIVPFVQHGPNNQLLQFMAAAALARYTAASLYPIPIKSHTLEKDNKQNGELKIHNMSAVVDLDLLIRYLHISGMSGVAGTASSSNPAGRDAVQSGTPRQPSSPHIVTPTHHYTANASRWLILYSENATMETFAGTQLDKQRRDLGPEHPATLKTASYTSNLLWRQGTMPLVTMPLVTTASYTSNLLWRQGPAISNFNIAPSLFCFNMACRKI